METPRTADSARGTRGRHDGPRGWKRRCKRLTEVATGKVVTAVYGSGEDASGGEVRRLSRSGLCALIPVWFLDFSYLSNP
ncbi:tbc1 domain family protein [Sesbania bispinosa]|nr:tbc1 domain family protein [Sesbania bispinosa]